ncbi:MAG TPA: hypothetical protein VMT61_08895 [Candidatus Binataceae bacterium]|nr:hypothetical protein [Candidatus Binataceae bacterium]
MASPNPNYTSVTLAPPATYSLNPIWYSGVEVAPSSGQYTFDSTTAKLGNNQLASYLSQGWNIVALTA